MRIVPSATGGHGDVQALCALKRQIAPTVSSCTMSAILKGRLRQSQRTILRLTGVEKPNNGVQYDYS
jgi:hypothetical protein